MDPGHEDKRPRLSTTTGWPAGPSHHGGHGVSLPPPGPPTHHSQPPLPPPTSSQYSPSPHVAQPPPPFSRPQEYPPSQQLQQPPPLPPQHFDDRRQHEPERYPSAQDHRHHHPAPSPARPPYPPSAYQPPGRDSMVVKRDPDEVKLPQITRPNSTGNGPEQSALPPPPAHGPVSVHMEERRHMSYDNGPGPQLYRHPTYPPPQTPISHPGPPPTPYDQNQMYAPPTIGPDGAYPIASYGAGGGKRKSQRASQACESCRQLKAKCDENKPCQNCLMKSINCVYRDPAPKQQDKTTQDLLDAVRGMLELDRRQIIAEVLAEMRSEFRALKNEANGSLNPPTSSSSHGALRDEPRPSTPQPLLEADEPAMYSPSDLPESGQIPDSEAAARRMRMLENEETTDEPAGQPMQPLEAPFPTHHTTPAGRLLKWPAIREMVRPLLEAEGVRSMDNYPQAWEERRGELALFGRGESFTNRTIEREPVNDFAEVSSAGDIADDVSQTGDHPSPSANTDWGNIGGLSPPSGSLSSDPRPHAPRHDHGYLEFDEKKVWNYVTSYKKHIQNMHPLIPPKDLDAMVVSFLEEIGAKKARTQAKFAAQPEGPIHQSMEFERKRKRSPVPNGVEGAPPNKKLKPKRSTKHALVLLVLALGKICTVRDRKLPDVYEKDTGYPKQGSPLVRNGHVTSPNQGSPPLSAFSQSPSQAGLPSPKEYERSAASRRSSMQVSGMQAPTSAASPAPLKKNWEVIPGLEYFAYATDILGNQFGGYSLTLIHAHILASLYYGQLGRVIPSFRHIRFACQAMVDKLQPIMERLSKSNGQIESPVHNKFMIAFWSCCQLESDILAELNLQPSGILQYEKLLPYPHGIIMVETFGFDEPVVWSYHAQLYLRKRLNEISGKLYNPDKKVRPDDQGILSEIEESIFKNKDIWAGIYKFDLNEPPSDDILHARFRAKFWGANVITYRPSIQEILAISYRQAHPEEYPDNNQDTINEISKTVLNNAIKGLNALQKSTQAFHGLHDKRFIITNPFGTAHAQWGNLVTLAAVYQNPYLGQFVEEENLRSLFERTIKFFEVVVQDTSSLAADLRILRGLLERLPPQHQITYIPLKDFTYDIMSNGHMQNPLAEPSPYANTPIDMMSQTPMELS